MPGERTGREGHLRRQPLPRKRAPGMPLVCPWRWRRGPPHLAPHHRGARRPAPPGAPRCGWTPWAPPEGRCGGPVSWAGPWREQTGTGEMDPSGCCKRMALLVSGGEPFARTECLRQGLSSTLSCKRVLLVLRPAFGWPGHSASVRGQSGVRQATAEGASSSPQRRAAGVSWVFAGPYFVLPNPGAVLCRCLGTHALVQGARVACWPCYKGGGDTRRGWHIQRGWAGKGTVGHRLGGLLASGDVRGRAWRPVVCRKPLSAVRWHYPRALPGAKVALAAACDWIAVNRCGRPTQRRKSWIRIFFLVAPLPLRRRARNKVPPRSPHPA